MTITFDIPPGIERAFAGDGASPSEGAKEAALVELYRRGKILHGELGAALGKSWNDVEVLLKRHGVILGVTAEEAAADARELLRLVKP